jgi:hypothetical protein
MRRVRTTKTLAKRIDLQYFSRPHAFRRWRLWLSLAIPVAALAWFAAQRATGQKIYSSGPLSFSHAVLGKRCEVCHITQAGVFRNEVTDQACLRCHDAPAHHPSKATFTPTCGSCHLEHKGPVRLASTIDAGCTQCHTDLQSKSGTVEYVRDIKNFDHQHPEFSALRPGATDPGQVKLNHYAHLRPNLAGPNGPVQMDCRDCHRLTGMEGTWPYAGPQAALAQVSVPTGDANPVQKMQADIRPSQARDYMAPILYATQCAGCHVKDLQFDKRFDQAAPHDKPEVVQAFLVQKYGEYFATHPGALSEPIAPERMLPGKFKAPLPVPHNRQEWIDLQVMLADRLLFDKGCKLCHVMMEGNGPLPAVAKSSIPARWLPHADFDHNSHRMLTCTSCHARTPDSKETADILLPGIASCRSCHQDRGVRHDAASARCSECHSYHDWTKEKPTKGTFTILQLTAAR